MSKQPKDAAPVDEAPALSEEIDPRTAALQEIAAIEWAVEQESPISALLRRVQEIAKKAIENA